ncbi:alanine dehydrogenase [Pelagibius sp.]|uniref:alanine dehydrogenase n=1 Tax=Pelagibius sp. TaxID=1931238 RepID=UPI003BB1DDE8
MLVGVPKEIKNHEYRVGPTPESASELTAHGHSVMVETSAGFGIGATDNDYLSAGAKIVDTADEVFGRAEMVVKVKEPQATERAKLREGQILYTYLHLAPDQTKDLVESGAICIAYETVTDDSGGLPLLKPMSQVAGRMSVQAGAAALEKAYGGRGVLLGGVPGVEPAKIVIIGGGIVGFNAAQMAVGNHADVTILDRNPAVLERLENHFEASAKVIYSTKTALERLVAEADLVIGAVLIPGAAAPKLVTRDMLSMMQDRAVIVDVAIDQGGCFEISRVTTHANPTFVFDGVVHYCVAIADKGWRQGLLDNSHLLTGLNVWEGRVTYRAVAEQLGYHFVPPVGVLN